jgi:hypothetical protein
MDAISDLPSAPGDIAWEALPPRAHVLQVYSGDASLLDALEGFAAAGLAAGETVIVIATPGHVALLEGRLQSRGLDLGAARAEDRLIELPAAETVQQFMLGDWPDEQLFRETMGPVIARARAGGRKVRAFGEMVALLWAAGNEPAAVRLEYLWNKLLATEQFPLFCAYPRAGFSEGLDAAVRSVCTAHTHTFST